MADKSNMKFASPQDQSKTESLATIDEIGTGDFIKRRIGILGRVNPLLKDFRKSQDAKASWNRSRSTYMKGINRWHSSTAGKFFHRQLGRFLSQRAPLYKESTDVYENNSEELTRDLICINSIKTHLLIESEYFVPDFDEHLSLNLMISHALEEIDRVFNLLVTKSQINEDQLVMLTDLYNKE